MQAEDEARNQLDSTSFSENPEAAPAVSKWLRLGLLAAVSAAVGGIAAIWIYRETVKKLHESGEIPENPNLHRPHPDDWL
jgi:hypothetical protein